MSWCHYNALALCKTLLMFCKISLLIMFNFACIFNALCDQNKFP